MIELAAAFMLAANNNDAGGELLCYASKRGPSEQVFVITKGPQNDLNQKGLRWIECPANFVWTAELALKRCAFLDHYEEEQRAAYEEEYGVRPETVCENGREAAGLPPSPTANE